MTKPNEPEGQKLRDLIAEVAADLSNENPFWTAKLLADALITRGIGIVAAQPVADAGGVTDADKKLLGHIVAWVHCPTIMSVEQVEQMIAAHRLQSVAAATAAKDAAIRARDDHFRNLQTLTKKYAQVCRAKTDLEYMQDELVGMLGPKAKQVWDMWQQQGLCRIHVSWVSHLQGEDRAEAHMEIDQAPKTVIDSVDGNLQKRPYGDTFSAFDAIADEVKAALSEAREAGYSLAAGDRV